MVKKKRMGIKECDKHLENLEFKPVLEARVRQVKWLFNNSNKCLMVYDEKLVRLMIHKLESKINSQNELIKEVAEWDEEHSSTRLKLWAHKFLEDKKV
jgi:hypothetical protein